MTRTFLNVAIALLLTVFTAAAAQAQVSGAAFDGFRSNGKDPIQIEADSLEVLDGENRAVFSGNVVVVQGKSTMKTSRLIVTYGADGSGGQRDVQQLDMSGGLVATSEDNTVVAEAGTYVTASEDIILTGDVVVSQGENVAKGCKLTANLKSNVANLRACSGGGRVSTIFTPGSANKN